MTFKNRGKDTGAGFKNRGSVIDGGTFTNRGAEDQSGRSFKNRGQDWFGGAFKNRGQTLLSSAFNPLSLFSSSEVGALFNPSDFSTMYQDSAATTPVTEANQPVGKLLDISGNGLHVVQATAGTRPYLRGTPVGDNLVTDPYFYDGSDWTAGAGWTVTAPESPAVTATSNLTYSGFTPVAGVTYCVEYSVIRSAGDVTVSIGGTSGTARTVTGRYYEYLTATDTTSFSFIGNGFTGSIGNVRVYNAENANVAAPYFIDCIGNRYLQGTISIASYPMTLAIKFANIAASGSPIGFSAYVSSTNYRIINTRGAVLDRKEGTIAPNLPINGNPIYRKEVQIGTFTESFITGFGDGISGTPAANTNSTSTNTLLGVGTGAGLFTIGAFYSGILINREVTAEEISNLSEYYGGIKSIQCWGDSLTLSLGSVVSTYPARLGNSINKTTINKGVGGESSTQITTRVIADTSYRKSWINIFWMGTNDDFVGDGLSTIKANIASCAASVTGKGRYLVLGTVMAESSTTLSDALIDELDTYLAATYGNKFVDVRAYLQSLNDGSANDLADVAAGLVPRSLRSDTVHLNDKGYQHVANLIESTLAILGWID